MIKLLPFHKMTMVTKLNPDEISNKLNDIVEQQMYTSVFREYDKEFYGVLGSDQCFFYNIPRFLNVPTIKVKMNWMPDAEGSTVFVSFSLPHWPVYLILMCVTLLLATLTFRNSIGYIFFPTLLILSPLTLFNINLSLVIYSLQNDLKLRPC